MAHAEGSLLVRHILGDCNEEEQHFMEKWLDEGNNKFTYQYMKNLLDIKEAVLA